MDLFISQEQKIINYFIFRIIIFFFFFSQIVKYYQYKTSNFKRNLKIKNVIYVNLKISQSHELFYEIVMYKQPKNKSHFTYRIKRINKRWKDPRGSARTRENLHSLFDPIVKSRVMNELSA